MRIISQDGMSDYPYDEIGLSIARNGSGTEYYIYQHSVHKEIRGKIATYSSLEKAKRVMAMLREEYQFEKQFETICCGTTDYPSKPLYYFQFPTDKELED